MKKLLKILGGLVGLIVLGVGGFVGWKVASWRPMFPDVPKPNLQASTDPQVIARGKYLVEAVSHCGACHTPVDEYTKLAPGQSPSLKGGHEWHMGPLATIRSSNLTPDVQTGIAGYTDDELARAIRHGVGKDGRGLLFMMGVGPMSDEDLIAVMSYVRSVPALSNAVPASEFGVMGKILFQGPMAFFARPHTYETPPYVPEGAAASVERGRYLAEGPAWCASCHSGFDAPEGDLRFVGQLMSGGTNPFPDETDTAFEFQAPNLTLDPETGHITKWTREQYMERMRAGRIHAGSPMPWESYRELTDADLESIWLYMQSLPPTHKLVGPPRREAGWKAEG